MVRCFITHVMMRLVDNCESTVLSAELACGCLLEAVSVFHTGWTSWASWLSLRTVSACGPDQTSNSSGPPPHSLAA